VGLLVLLPDLGLLRVGLLVLVPVWVCGSVGGVTGMGVWVCCWRGCVDLLVVLLMWCVDADESVVLKKIYKKELFYYILIGCIVKWVKLKYSSLGQVY
jgi:hypothetical protein